MIMYCRWEKQELERQIRELKKTTEDLQRQSKRRGSLTRQASTEKDESSTDSKTQGVDLEKLKAEKEELLNKVKDVRT